jgi:hypothetical protein
MARNSSVAGVWEGLYVRADENGKTTGAARPMESVMANPKSLQGVFAPAV